MSDDFQQLRSALRKSTLAARNRLPQADRQARSQQALEQLWNLAAFQEADNLFIYVNYHSELETLPLIDRCLANAAFTVTVPLTLPNEGLDAYKINEPTKELAPGFCSIPEPITELTQKFEPSKIDIVILPGSVFDLNGGRLGYGGGYYDRFLQNSAPQALRIALAYEMQVVDQVPVMDHDQPVDYLITEKRVVNINS